MGGGSLKDDDSATDSDDFNGDLPDSTSGLFVEGEKVLAYHGPRIYEAKVISLSPSFYIFQFFFNLYVYNFVCISCF